MTTDEQIRAYIAKLDLARSAYERDHPEWRHESLLWILQWGLSSLRRLLKTKGTEISWAAPFVELRFPVECSWTPQGETPFVVTSGKIRPADLSDEGVMLKSLAKMMICQLEIDTLQDLTNYAVYVRVGDSNRTLSGSYDVERLEAIESEEERNEQVRNLLKPCSFGGGTIQLPSDIEVGAAIPESAATQLSEIKPPLIMVPLLGGANKGEVATIFEIQPMVVNLERKEAYFPIIVGLTLFAAEDESRALKNLSPGYLKFADWSEEQRDGLWAALFAAIADDLVKLGPVASKEIGAAILTVNAQIQVKQLENETIEDLRRRALTEIQQVGTVVKFDSEIEAQAKAISAKQISEALEQVESASDGHVKGRALEELMVALFSSISCFQMRKGVRTESEEIDLVIANSGELSEFRSEGPIILVECKNWSGTCGKNEYVLFKEKMRNRGERCTLGFLVSWKGFPGTITTEMLRSSQGKLLIVPLAGNTIREAIKANTFLQCIRDAWQKALLV